jgi:hypothetical protein
MGGCGGSYNGESSSTRYARGGLPTYLGGTKPGRTNSVSLLTQQPIPGQGGWGSSIETTALDDSLRTGGNTGAGSSDGPGADSGGNDGTGGGGGGGSGFAGSVGGMGGTDSAGVGGTGGAGTLGAGGGGGSGGEDPGGTGGAGGNGAVIVLYVK